MKPVALGRACCLVLAAIAMLGQSGCYYVQAARGQLEVIRKREPIDEVIESRDTSEQLAARLRLVSEARRFSIEELGLPDNDSYRSYADLERPFVIWNVIAAPEYSLRAREWCYPVVGCVSYRGYFSESAARRKADDLMDEGFDVAMGGVAAYSTLGRFADPILNSMMHWDDIELISVMFHELAHQVLYIKDDSGFNESFATAVEEIAIERWLEFIGRSEDLESYRRRRANQREMMKLLAGARSDLEAVYGKEMPEADKALAKRERFARLASELDAHFASTGQAAPAWVHDGLNNARLVSMSLYLGRLPAFRRMYLECGQDLACFYSRARSVSRLDETERNGQLDALGEPAS